MIMIAAEPDLTAQIASLLRETGGAHHRAYLATNGDDPEWPIWYADYLHLKLNSLMHTHWTRSDLVHLFVRMEKERSAGPNSASWPEFYARRLIEEDRGDN